MATFYAKGKVDLTTLLTFLGMQESLKNVSCICFFFSLILFMSLKMMSMMIIMLSKIKYIRNLFQIFMGSIGMLKHGSIGLLVTSWYNVLKAQSSPQGPLHLWQMLFLRLSLWNKKHLTNRKFHYHLCISFHQLLLISVTFLMKIFHAYEFWCEYIWFISALGFRSLHYGRHAFKYESNLGWSFKIIIDCLKAMFITPHLSKELRALDYNKIKVPNVTSIPITFNDDIIFELLPICLPIVHSKQM